MLNILTILLIGSLTIAQTATIGRHQRVCAKGRVACTANGAHRVEQVVKLWDHDKGPNPDDLMDESMTDDDGSFQVCGTATDIIGKIDPELVIYTECNNEAEDEERCYRKLTFKIPKSFIGRTYRFTEIIDLAWKRESEERHCLTGSRLNDILKNVSGKSAGQWLKTVVGIEEDKGIFQAMKEKGMNLWKRITDAF